MTSRQGLGVTPLPPFGHPPRCWGRASTRLVALIVVLIATTAFAHKPSDAYLTLEPNGTHLTGRLDTAIRDLDDTLILDASSDGNVTWGELKARFPDADTYLLGHLRLSVPQGACTNTATGHQLVEHTDGNYLVLRFDAACPGPADDVSVDYSLFFERDPQHRGLVRLGNHSLVLSDTSRTGRFDARERQEERGFKSVFEGGVHHILSGVDHLLFLAALLLPSVLRRKQRDWEPAGSLPTVLAEVARTVTAFTVAHSLTLSLATLGWAVPPSRLVEPAIAASVALAAIDNNVPFLGNARWAPAFTMGLMHGFGFAGALQDLGLSGSSLALALFGFNIGVEAGQLSVVLAFLPLMYFGRKSRLYTLFLKFGSYVIAGIAVVWFCERVFEFKLLPF